MVERDDDEERLARIERTIERVQRQQTELQHFVERSQMADRRQRRDLVPFDRRAGMASGRADRRSAQKETE